MPLYGDYFQEAAALNLLHVLAAVAALASRTRINVLRRRTDVPADFFVLLNGSGLSARSRSAQARFNLRFQPHPTTIGPQWRDGRMIAEDGDSDRRTTWLESRRGKNRK